MAKGIHFVEKGISEVDSKTHLPLQFMDLILGAICFKLNEKDKLKSDGEERPGKRTILKLKMYKYINSKIRELYPYFNSGELFSVINKQLPAFMLIFCDATTYLVGATMNGNLHVLELFFS